MASFNRVVAAVVAKMNEVYSENSDKPWGGNNRDLVLSIDDEVRSYEVSVAGEVVKVAVSEWACGAVVAYGTMMFFISEDDGQWGAGTYGEISSAYSKSLSDALARLGKWLEENGTPYRYCHGKDENGNEIYGDICGYVI